MLIMLKISLPPIILYCYYLSIAALIHQISGRCSAFVTIFRVNALKVLNSQVE